MLPIWSKCISGSCPNHSWRSDFRPLLRGYHSFKISFKKPQKSSKNRIYTRKSTIFIDVPPQYRLRALQSAVLLLPDENREVLQTLLLFLSDISECKDVNQMPASNLAVCFAPSLFQIAMNNPKFKLRSRVSQTKFKNFWYFWQNLKKCSDQTPLHWYKSRSSGWKRHCWIGCRSPVLDFYDQRY